MKLSPISKEQAIKILKVTVYVSVSAALDYLIALTTGSQFGVFTPLINTVLVLIKQAFTPAKK